MACREPVQSGDIPASPRVSLWRWWLGTFAAFLALYGATANRGAQWQDSGSHILRIVTHEVINPRGLALSHPLHHWLGRFAVSLDLFEPSHAITLVSVLAAAIAVANTFGCAYALTHCKAPALLAACTLGVAHTFWQMATVTEVNTLVAACLSGECWALVSFAQSRRRANLWLALLLNGFGFANHNLALLTFPVLGVVAWVSLARRDLTWRDVAVGAIFWLFGSLPYTSLVVSELGRSGEWTGTLSSALFGHSFRGHVFNTSIRPLRFLFGLAFIGMNFPNLLLLATLSGVFFAGRVGVPRMAHRSLLAGLCIHALFALRYPVVDQHTFFLPMYVLFALLGAIGFAAWRKLLRGRSRGLLLAAAVAMVAATPVVYAMLPAAARRWRVLDGYLRNKPYRDDYAYIFTPWSVAETSAERMSEHAVTLAGARGLIVVSDSMSEPAILLKLYGARDRDVQVTRELTPEALLRAVRDARRVVFVPPNVEKPPPEVKSGRWRRDGDLYVYEEPVRADG